jgi:hypothetical protein
MNDGERERLIWTNRLEVASSFLFAAREFIAQEDYEHALLMFVFVEEELSQLRRAVLPYAIRPERQEEA